MRSFPLLQESGTRCAAASAETSTSRKRCSVKDVRHSCVSARPRSAGTAVGRSVTMILMVMLVAGRGVEAFSDIASRAVLVTSSLNNNAGRFADSSAMPKLDVTKQSPKSTATNSMLFASSLQPSPNGEPPIRSTRAARIFASLFAHLQEFQSSLGKHTKTARRILAVLLLATAVFLGGAVDPALAGRSGGRAGGSFGRSYRAPPMSRPMHRPGSMGGGMRSSPMLHPGMYRRHPAIYFMPRPGFNREPPLPMHRRPTRRVEQRQLPIPTEKQVRILRVAEKSLK